MTKEEKLYATAPCGLMCYGCFGYKKGGIPYHASRLHNLYRGWYSGHSSGVNFTWEIDDLPYCNC